MRSNSVTKIQKAAFWAKTRGFIYMAREYKKRKNSYYHIKKVDDVLINGWIKPFKTIRASELDNMSAITKKQIDKCEEIEEANKKARYNELEKLKQDKLFIYNIKYLVGSFLKNTFCKSKTLKHEYKIGPHFSYLEPESKEKLIIETENKLKEDIAEQLIVHWKNNKHSTEYVDTASANVNVALVDRKEFVDFIQSLKEITD